MDKIIKVRFVTTQGAEDLYKNIESGRIYARIPANVDSIVFWTTTSKWIGGYEADCPIRAGVKMQVVDKDENTLFEEELYEDTWNGRTSAEKKGPFYREAVKSVKEKLIDDRNLRGFEHHVRSYEQWKKWLVSAMDEHGYKGYRDNWVHYEVEEINSVVIKTPVILGHKHKVFEITCRHRICGKEWTEIRMSDLDQLPCGEICGYVFDELS